MMLCPVYRVRSKLEFVVFNFHAFLLCAIFKSLSSVFHFFMCLIYFLVTSCTQNTVTIECKLDGEVHRTLTTAC